MTVLNSEVFSHLRKLFVTRRCHLRRRTLENSSGRVAARIDSLEQRQMLVSQVPMQLVVNTSQAPMTVQWVQPAGDPAESFQLTIERTDLTGGGEQTIVSDPAIASTVAAGLTETYTISQTLPLGSYTVSVAARDGGATANVTTTAAATTTFSIGEVAPQMLSVSGRPFSSSPANRPVVGRSVTLTWTVLPDVKDYYVWIGKKNGTTYTQVTDAALPKVAGGVCELNLAVGEYRVKTRALNRTPELWSEPVDFEVAGLQAIAPRITNTPTELGSGAALTWGRLANTVRYHVELTSDSGTAPVIFETSAAEYGGSFLATGNYSARVRGFAASGRPTNWSVPVAFTIDDATYKPVLTTTPAGSQTNPQTSEHFSGLVNYVCA